MSNPPPSPVAIEVATLALLRAAPTAMADFIEALRAESLTQTRILLSADFHTVHSAQGAAQALDRFLTRVVNAREIVEAHNEKMRANQERRR